MVHYGDMMIDGTSDPSINPQQEGHVGAPADPILLYACITFAVVWLIIVVMLRYRKMKVYLMGAPTGNATGQFAGQRPLNLDHASHSLSARTRAVLVCMQPWCVQNHGRRQVTVDCTMQGSRTRWSSRSSYEAPRIPRHWRRQSCPTS